MVVAARPVRAPRAADGRAVARMTPHHRPVPGTVTAQADRAGQAGGPHVAVFRALMLGDLLCATPALRALRQGWPQARLTLVGLPWARALAQRLASVDDFLACPGWPGLPEQPLHDRRAMAAFLAAARARRFDLAVQLHGSGPVVNPLVAALGAPRLAAFGDPPPGRGRRPGDPAGADDGPFVPWPATGTEVERLLRLTDAMGLPRRGLHLDFPLRDGDRDRAEALCAPLAGRPFAVVHVGSQLPSRRWPAERFAQVADRLAGDGLAVVLTGSAGEAPLTAAVAAAMRAPALDLAGRTDLWSLGALVEWAALVVCNDTGLSHVAAALGTPSVVVASGSDVARWSPADARRHAVLWHDVDCRPCGHRTCPVPGHPCASGVSVAGVRAAVRAVLAQGRRPVSPPVPSAAATVPGMVPGTMAPGVAVDGPSRPAAPPPSPRPATWRLPAVPAAVRAADARNPAAGVPPAAGPAMRPAG